MNEKNIFPYDPKYPSVEELRLKCRSRIPKFAFNYLEGGANEGLNKARNESDFDDILLKPHYLKETQEINMSVELFGKRYAAPFGISPIGLQGLMWPGSPEILAKASFKNNIPYILSTVSTGNIENIAKASEGTAWFQLYHPTENRLRDNIINRLKAVECPVLVVLVDVPAFGLRYEEIKSGLSMPPKLNINNIFQALTRPSWSLNTLKTGIPNFGTLKPYMDENLDLAQLGQFMNATFTGKVTVEKIKAIRDLWPGPLVLKGITTEEDIEAAIEIGVDGVIVSNHGGRQIDAGESSIKSTIKLAGNPNYSNRIKIMMDGGIRSGVDIARACAIGSEFNFMGRPFMYGVGALGNKGGDHTINMFKTHLYQIMKQLSVDQISDFPKRLLKDSKILNHFH